MPQKPKFTLEKIAADNKVTPFFFSTKKYLEFLELVKRFSGKMAVPTDYNASLGFNTGPHEPMTASFNVPYPKAGHLFSSSNEGGFIGTMPPAHKEKQHSLLHNPSPPPLPSISNSRELEPLKFNYNLDLHAISSDKPDPLPLKLSYTPVEPAPDLHLSFPKTDYGLDLNPPAKPLPSYEFEPLKKSDYNFDFKYDLNPLPPSYEYHRHKETTPYVPLHHQTPLKDPREKEEEDSKPFFDISLPKIDFKLPKIDFKFPEFHFPKIDISFPDFGFFGDEKDKEKKPKDFEEDNLDIPVRYSSASVDTLSLLPLRIWVIVALFRFTMA